MNYKSQYKINWLSHEKIDPDINIARTQNLMLILICFMDCKAFPISNHNYGFIVVRLKERDFMSWQTSQREKTVYHTTSRLRRK